jgi:hypothetical protein
LLQDILLLDILLRNLIIIIEGYDQKCG